MIYYLAGFVRFGGVPAGFVGRTQYFRAAVPVG